MKLQLRQPEITILLRWDVDSGPFAATYGDRNPRIRVERLSVDVLRSDDPADGEIYAEGHVSGRTVTRAGDWKSATASPADWSDPVSKATRVAIQEWVSTHADDIMRALQLDVAALELTIEVPE